MSFRLAPGTLTALSGRTDNRAYYIFDGDLNQMGLIEDALRGAGFPVVKSDVYPGFPENDKETYVRALRFVYERRIEGWWNQREKLIEHGICTEDEFKIALGVQVETSKATYVCGSCQGDNHQYCFVPSCTCCHGNQGSKDARP